MKFEKLSEIFESTKSCVICRHSQTSVREKKHFDEYLTLSIRKLIYRKDTRLTSFPYSFFFFSKLNKNALRETKEAREKNKFIDKYTEM